METLKRPLHTHRHISNQENVYESGGCKRKPNCYARWEKQSREAGKLVETMQPTGNSNSTLNFAPSLLFRVSSNPLAALQRDLKQHYLLTAHAAARASTLWVFLALIIRGILLFIPCTHRAGLPMSLLCSIFYTAGAFSAPVMFSCVS